MGLNAKKTEYDLREILVSEATQASLLEETCFLKEEACDLEMIEDRIGKAQDMFLVAVEKESNQLIGMLTGIATNEEKFKDEFFYDASLHRKEGKNVMLLGLEVLPQYQGQGIAKDLMDTYLKNMKARNKEKAYLTCHDTLIPLYEKMGFINLGLSASSWGGSQWYDMVYYL